MANNFFSATERFDLYNLAYFRSSTLWGQKYDIEIPIALPDDCQHGGELQKKEWLVFRCLREGAEKNYGCAGTFTSKKI